MVRLRIVFSSEHRQVVVLFAGVRGYLDKLDTKKIAEFEAKWRDFVIANKAAELQNMGKGWVGTTWIRPLFGNGAGSAQNVPRI